MQEGKLVFCEKAPGKCYPSSVSHLCLYALFLTLWIFFALLPLLSCFLPPDEIVEESFTAKDIEEIVRDDDDEVENGEPDEEYDLYFPSFLFTPSLLLLPHTFLYAE